MFIITKAFHATRRTEHVLQEALVLITCCVALPGLDANAQSANSDPAFVRYLPSSTQQIVTLDTERILSYRNLKTRITESGTVSLDILLSSLNRFETRADIRSVQRATVIHFQDSMHPTKSGLSIVLLNTKLSLDDLVKPFRARLGTKVIHKDYEGKRAIEFSLANSQRLQKLTIVQIEPSLIAMGDSKVIRPYLWAKKYEADRIPVAFGSFAQPGMLHIANDAGASKYCYFARTSLRAYDQVPKQLGLQSSADDMRWFRLKFDLLNSDLATLAFQAGDHSDLGEFRQDIELLAKLIPGILASKFLMELGEDQQNIKRPLLDVLARGKVRQRDELFEITFPNDQRIGAAYAAAIRSSATADSSAYDLAKRTAALRNIGLLMFSHAQHQRGFIEDIELKSGEPLLSWRVRAQEIQLGRTFAYAKTEPWNSDYNRKMLLQKETDLWSVGSSKQGATRFLRVRPIDRGGKPLPFYDLTRLERSSKPASNIILIVEVANDKAVPWSKPVDFNVKMESPMTPLGDLTDGIFLALMCDGSVKQFDRDELTDEEFLNMCSDQEISVPAKRLNRN